MGSRTIPQKTIIVCDRCGRERSSMDCTGLHLRGTAASRGWGGAAGGSRYTLDLCERCMRALTRWLAGDDGGDRGE